MADTRIKLLPSSQWLLGNWYNPVSNNTSKSNKQLQMQDMKQHRSNHIVADKENIHVNANKKTSHHPRKQLASVVEETSEATITISQTPSKRPRLGTASKINLQLGSITHTGGKSENQDVSFYFMHEKEGCVIGLFDGHGKYGGEIAKLSHDLFAQSSWEVISSHTEITKQSLHACFHKAEKYICQKLTAYAQNSGTTATLVIVRDSMLSIAHTGDSRAVLARLNETASATSSSSNRKLAAVRVTIDHRFDVQEEFDMVTKAGGIVKRRDNRSNGALRVWLPERFEQQFGPGPGLMISRSIGDLRAKLAGCSAIPDVYMSAITPLDKFLIVASDGLWDVISDEEAVNFVHLLKHPKDESWGKLCAQELMNEAIKRGNQMNMKMDNITIVVMQIHQ